MKTTEEQILEEIWVSSTPGVDDMRDALGGDEELAQAICILSRKVDELTQKLKEVERKADSAFHSTWKEDGR